MRAIRLSFFQMLAAMRRDMMLSVSCLVPVLAGLFFRFGVPFLETVLTGYFQVPAVISPYYRLVDVLFVMLSPTMFCFVSAMVALEEADEKTATYLFITPLGKTGYFVSRFGVPAVTAFWVTILLLPAFKLTEFSPAAILLFAAGGTLQGMIVALLILTFSSNKLEGMAVAKLSTLTIFGAVVPFFIKNSMLLNNMQYVFFLLPSFWIGKAACEGMLIYLFPALALATVWTVLLLERFLSTTFFLHILQ